MARFALSLVLLFVLSTVAAAEPLRVVTLSYPPYEYMEDGEVKGVATRIVREVFRRMDVEIEIELMPWVDALEAVRTGKADAIYTAFKTPERERYLLYPSTELIGQTTSLFVHKGSDIDYSGQLKPLGNYTFAVVHGVSYGSFFDSAVKEGHVRRLVRSVNGTESVKRFLDGEADILVSNWLEARTILRTLGRENEAEVLTPPLQNILSYLAFSSKSDRLQLLGEFERNLRQIRMDGTYGRLFQAN
ncbi:substrate-binding periplasmic protein [Salidesulfovibrio brasiliensis]|uniref:substrate-binding periplasmic protein n=1 Tax=Salidesulfovibrio brasiliensis TaxID=221711 RepID=UPI0006D1F5DF|nr:transporter substrate-binding domain-containing protein [Salidesulfovibrio brasiliensis]